MKPEKKINYTKRYKKNEGEKKALIRGQIKFFSLRVELN